MTCTVCFQSLVTPFLVCYFGMQAYEQPSVKFFLIITSSIWVNTRDLVKCEKH